VAFVTAVLGISIFLLLTFILSLLSRINLLERQISSIENMIKESDDKLQEAQALISKLASEATAKVD
jgi:septal ring factor EnvC (AmiA/AmiB activator)